MKSKPRAFLLITGDEFLRRSKIESILEQLLPGTLRSSNLVRVYPDELQWPSIVAQATTPSLLGGKQVFWISQADRIKKGNWEPFEAYCKQPAGDSCFIFEADDVSKTHPLAKLATKFGERITFSGRAAEQGFSMLHEKVRQARKKLTPAAWQALADRLGGSPRMMDLAIDQLILYSDEPEVDERAVESVAAKWLRYDPFELTEALAQQDTEKAIRIFHYFYELNGDATSTIGLIHWQLKRLWRAKKIIASGGRGQDVGRALRVPPFRMNAFSSQVKRFQLETLERLIEELWEIDWQMKKGACDPLIAMESFLITAR